MSPSPVEAAFQRLYTAKAAEETAIAKFNAADQAAQQSQVNLDAAIAAAEAAKQARNTAWNDRAAAGQVMAMAHTETYGAVQGILAAYAAVGSSGAGV